MALAVAEVQGRAVAVTSGDDGTVRVWDLTTQEQIGTALGNRCRGARMAAAGTVNGRPVLATSGRDDRAVCLHDVETGRRMRPDLVFPEQVRAVAFAPGGELVVGFGTEVAVLAPPRPNDVRR
jgi:WD40 repeat protein